MAARVTKSAFEAAVLPTTQQVRITKAAFEAAVLPTTQQVRITKAAMQVAYVVAGPINPAIINNPVSI